MIQERSGGIYLSSGEDYGDRVGRDLWMERVGVVTEDIENFEFGGLKHNDLVSAVAWVADKMGMKESEASRIEVLFGDEIAIKGGRGGENLTWATTSPFFDGEGERAKVVGCSIVINRAREIIEPAMVSIRGENGVGLEAGSRVSFKVEDPERMVVVKFKEPWELVWWIIAEEMKHARDFLRAGDIATLDRWQVKMDEIIRRNGREGLICERSRDVMEFASSRVSCRLLARVCQEIMGDGQRADYYLEKYKQSQSIKDMIYVDISQVWQRSFVSVRS